MLWAEMFNLMKLKVKEGIPSSLTEIQNLFCHALIIEPLFKNKYRSSDMNVTQHLAGKVAKLVFECMSKFQITETLNPIGDPFKSLILCHYMNQYLIH